MKNLNLNKNYLYFLFFIIILILIGVKLLACFNEVAELKKELLANKVFIKTLKKEIEILTAVKIAVVSPKVSSYSLTLMHYITLAIASTVATYGLYVLFSTSGSQPVVNISDNLDNFNKSSAAESDVGRTLNLVLDTTDKIAQSNCSDAFKGKFNTIRGCQPPEFIKTELTNSAPISETIPTFLENVSLTAYSWVEFFTFW